MGKQTDSTVPRPMAKIEFEGKVFEVPFGASGRNSRGGIVSGPEQSDFDEVDQASKESFPASDPPAFNP